MRCVWWWFGCGTGAGVPVPQASVHVSLSNRQLWQVIATRQLCGVPLTRRRGSPHPQALPRARSVRSKLPPRKQNPSLPRHRARPVRFPARRGAVKSEFLAVSNLDGAYERIAEATSRKPRNLVRDLVAVRMPWPSSERMYRKSETGRNRSADCADFRREKPVNLRSSAKSADENSCPTEFRHRFLAVFSG